MAQGTFRVTINGFRVTQPVTENWLSANDDGKGNEVMVSTSVKAAKADGTIVYTTQSTSPIMGDTWRLPGRIQAGTISDRGGLQAGDEFPDHPWLRTIPLTASRDYPPMKVFEAELVDGEDVVFITPFLLEASTGPGLPQRLIDWHARTDAAFGAKAKEIWTKPFPWIGFIFDAVSLGIQTAATLWDDLDQTRPIGMQPDPTDPSGKRYAYTPSILPLTYARAKAIASSNPTGRGNGLLQIPYTEPSPLSGYYTLYLQVEEVTATTLTDQWRDVGHANHVTAMTAENGRLYATTSDQRLWVRDPVLSEVDWRELGVAVDVVALAGFDGQLFAADRQNRLWQRSVSDGAVWQHIGHANDVVAMTYSTGFLLAATRDGRLWARPPVPVDVDWFVFGTAPAVTAMTTGFGNLAASTTSGALQIRPPLPFPGLPWTTVGTVPTGVVGIAGTGEALFAATATNRLLVRSIV